MTIQEGRLSDKVTHVLLSDEFVSAGEWRVPPLLRPIVRDASRWCGSTSSPIYCAAFAEFVKGDKKGSLKHGALPFMVRLSSIPFSSPFPILLSALSRLPATPFYFYFLPSLSLGSRVD